MSTDAKYVFAAYSIVFVVVLVYVVIMALKLVRLDRQTQRARSPPRGAVIELLFWPALLAYGEAAVAFLGEARRPGLGCALGIWGIRIGWLVQTALLAAQAARAGGLPVGELGRLAQPLRLARRRRLPRLGLLAPLSACSGSASLRWPRCFSASRARPARSRCTEAAHYSSVFLVLHVGLVLAAFAGFTVAAGLAGLYLWQERRLKRHDAAILARPAPSLVALEGLVARTILVALPLLTVGLGIGIARMRDQSAKLRRRHARGDRHVGALRRLSRRALRARVARAALRLPRARRVRARRPRPPRASGGALLVTQLVLVGTSHHAAPIELRETIALDLAGAGALSLQLAESGSRRSASRPATAPSSTSPAPDGDDAERRASAALVALAGVAEAELVPVLYRLRDEAAALHLFRVAAGLDSLVPGEGEILGQVRDAFEAGVAGPFLDHVFRQALHTGKKVRTQTAIAREPGIGPVGGGRARAARLRRARRTPRPRRRRRRDGRERRAQPERRAARRSPASPTARSSTPRPSRSASAPSPRPSTSSRSASPQADVVVSCTSAPGTILARAQLERVQRARRGAPLFLVDLAVPRDLDPAINDLEGCYLYNVDDLQAVVAQTLAGRRQEAARAEGIVAQRGGRLPRLAEPRSTSCPRSRRCARTPRRSARASSTRAEARLGRLSDEQRSVVESLTTQIVNKLLHLPTVRMKQAAAAVRRGGLC